MIDTYDVNGKKIIFRATTMKPEQRAVLAVPFAVDDEGTERLDEDRSGSVPILHFEFFPDDYELLDKLRIKQTAALDSNDMALIMNPDQWFLEKEIANLLSEILRDYMLSEREVEIGAINLPASYRISDILKAKAASLLERKI